MGAFLLTMTDIVFFNPLTNEGAILMAPAMRPTTTTSKNMANFKNLALLGDEQQWIFPACPYTKPPFVTPGTVMCKILALNPAHISKNIMENGKSVLLVGNGVPFIAQFMVIKPAADPILQIPDPQPIYTGRGNFIQAVPSKAQN